MKTMLACAALAVLALTGCASLVAHHAEQLAEQGDAYGQATLGVMYFSGQGMPQDYEKAAHWSRKVAEQGDAYGQMLLGLMYLEGQGVPQDYEQAVHWLRKAAEQGNAPGLGGLGSMYLEGRGVPQDDVQAYAWLDLAAAAGLEGAMKTRDELLARMTPGQVVKAKALSRDLAAKHLE